MRREGSRSTNKIERVLERGVKTSARHRHCFLRRDGKVAAEEILCEKIGDSKEKRTREQSSVQGWLIGGAWAIKASGKRGDPRKTTEYRVTDEKLMA